METINVGNGPNTRTGESVRTAFQKCNANFQAAGQSFQDVLVRLSQMEKVDLETIQLVGRVQQIQQDLSTSLQTLGTALGGKQAKIDPFHLTAATPTAALPTDLPTSLSLLSILNNAVGVEINKTNSRVNQVATDVNKLTAVLSEWIAKSKTQGLQT